MKRALALCLLATLVLVAPGVARANVAVDCTGRALVPAGVRSLIRCVAPKLDVSTSKALHVAWRESRDRPGETNHHGSSACGVYQIVSGTWPSVAHFDYGPLIDSTPFHWQCKDGRANVILALRYVAHRGWGPWGG